MNCVTSGNDGNILYGSLEIYKSNSRILFMKVEECTLK